MRRPPLRALFEGQQATVEPIRAEVAALTDRNRNLEHRDRRFEHLVRELRRAIYGKKSEKRDPDQFLLAFEELEGAPAESDAPASTTPTPRAKCPDAEHNIGHVPAHLPRVFDVIEPESTLCPCGCGEMTKIGEDRTGRLHVVPAKLQVIVTVRPKHACHKCMDHLVASGSAAIRYASLRWCPASGKRTARLRLTSVQDKSCGCQGGHYGGDNLPIHRHSAFAH